MMPLSVAAFFVIGLFVVGLAALALHPNEPRLRRMPGRRDINIADYLRLESPRRVGRAIRASCPNNDAWVGSRKRSVGLQ